MPAATSSQSAELLERARALSPIIEADAEEAERQGKLTRRTVEAIKGAGLYDLMLPKQFGGAEADPVTQVLVFEELTRADASAGWCVMACAACSAAAGAYFSDAEADELFAGRQNVVIGGHAAPLGQAVPEDGGFRVSGHWQFGSGTAHADWVIGGCLVMEDGAPRMQPNGMPEMRVMHFPRHEVEFLGNWDVMGLAASGSFDYAVKEVFVPEGRTYLTVTTEPLRGGPVYRMGLVGLVASGHSAYALGVGRRAMDEIAAISKSRQRRGSPVLVDQPVFQERYAHAEAQLRSARSFLLDTMAAAWDELQGGGAFGLPQRALVRLATSHATLVAAEVTAFAYHSAGTQALRWPNALQRCFRDINAATQHVYVDDSVWLNSAKVLLGVAPEGMML